MEEEGEGGKTKERVKRITEGGSVTVISRQEANRILTTTAVTSSPDTY